MLPWRPSVVSNLALVCFCLAGAGSGRRVQSKQQGLSDRPQVPFDSAEALAKLLSSSSQNAFAFPRFGGRSYVRDASLIVSQDRRARSLSVMSDDGSTATGEKVKTEEAPQINWAPIIGHMNEDHGDSIIAYTEFFGGLSDVQSAIINDMDMEGFSVSAELGDGSKQDIKIPYEGGPIKNMQGMGKAVKVMSKKARDEVFVSRAPGVVEKLGFETFNKLNGIFKDKCADASFADLADMYADDAVLVPQFQGPPPANAPLYFGKEAVKSFFEAKGPALLKGLTLKPIRLHQKSDTEVTEIGRAWGLPGRSYSRQWEKVDGKWLLKHDYLPVGP